MILRTFNTNQVYIFVFIPLVILALRWPTLIGEAPFTPSGQLPFLSDFFVWLSGHSWLSLLLSIAAITFQGYWISWLANEHRLLPYTSNLPAFILVICYSVLAPQTWFSPVIFANIFLVLSLKRTTDIYHQGEINSDLFRGGIYIALASILYLPSLFMLLIVYYDLAIIRSFHWREYVMPVVGIISIYFWLFAFYFFTEQSDIFFNYFIEPKTFLMVFNWKLSNWLPALILILLTALSFSHLFLSGRKRTVRENNLYKVLSVTLICSGLMTIIFMKDLLSVSVLIWPALAILISYYLMGMNRKWIPEFIVYLLLFVIIFRDVMAHI